MMTESVDLDFLIESLSTIPDREYQMRVWYRAEGPEVDDYGEFAISFDQDIDYLRSLLREGKTTLDPQQVKAVLRVYMMSHYFNKTLSETDIPEDWKESELFVINHPRWKKIGEQAQYALSLLKRKNQGLRKYGAPKPRNWKMLDDQFRSRIKVFVEVGSFHEIFKSIDDFWNASNRFYDVFEKFLKGWGSISSGTRFQAIFAFEKSLGGLCADCDENDVVDLGHFFQNPLFPEVVKAAETYMRASS